MNTDFSRDLLVEGLVHPPPVEKPGPRQCCAEYAIVERCNGETDFCWCGVCDRRWTQLCAVGDFVPAVEA